MGFSHLIATIDCLKKHRLPLCQAFTCAHENIETGIKSKRLSIWYISLSANKVIFIHLANAIPNRWLRRVHFLQNFIQGLNSTLLQLDKDFSVNYIQIGHDIDVRTWVTVDNVFIFRIMIYEFIHLFTFLQKNHFQIIFL